MLTVVTVVTLILVTVVDTMACVDSGYSGDTDTGYCSDYGAMSVQCV